MAGGKGLLFFDEGVGVVFGEALCLGTAHHSLRSNSKLSQDPIHRHLFEIDHI
jgi:hypothetical protein